MDENSTSENNTTPRLEAANSNDSDIEILETSMPVVSIDLDNDEVNGSQVDAPLVAIRFRNKELFEKLQRAVSSALEAVFQEHLPNESINIAQGKDGCSLEAQEKGASETDRWFVIDSTPMKNKKNDGQIPSYKKSMNKVFDGQTPPSASGSLSKRPKGKQTCWNCEGDHALKDCKQPRNYTRIRQKKEEFQRKSDRYHADLEQKYGHFRPGALSEGLRGALGLGSRDLPLHVYRMRMFGYPPGWLEDAKITHSGLQLFGSNGDAVQHSDESDGEVDNVRMKYDVRKIIEYPGFNEPPPEGMFDDWKYYKVPPYTEELGRDNMIRQLEGTLVGGYRRKKLKMSNEPDAETNDDPTVNREVVDMDAMECSPPPPEAAKSNELEDGELSSDTELNNATSAVDDSVILVETPVEVISLDDTPLVVPEPAPPSPTLADLQAKQKQLEDQLANNVTMTEESSFVSDILLAENLAADQSMEESPSTSSLPAAPADTVPTQPAEQLANCTVLSEDCSFMNDILLAEKLAAEQSLQVPSTSTAPCFIEPPRPPSPPKTNTLDECVPSERPPEPETFDLGEIAMNKVPYIDEPASMGLKRMSLGTPILKAFTPYDTLPSGEAFSKGVSDVIHFENLPDSTGKYEQMKSLLSEVRQKMNKHLREMDDGR
ncbi:AGAP005070-PA [Anopheles gambiae str. PEST]|uniref:AGAP005070-PA n=1 Tax=Anopheles gambiae TaxID=7165 RepID=Q7Q9S3_ANOGA|nr:AGAP005070-PA [Anopheles gambiae str. PEST]